MQGFFETFDAMMVSFSWCRSFHPKGTGTIGCLPGPSADPEARALTLFSNALTPFRMSFS
jgi:hypothetical protein